jgi:enoyl-CoA hydratase/carnithine racemase
MAEVEKLEVVRVAHEGDRFVRVTLDRPPANALSHQVMAELDTVCSHLEGTEAQVVVLDSAAPMFMAGADLKMVNAGWDELRATIKKCQSVFNRWERLPMMTVAVINGHAAGAGCELSLASDWRLMARGKARIGLPEVLRGLLPGGGGTQRMARLIGRGKALDLCLRGRLIDAEEAESIGLVHEAVDADKLSDRVNELVGELLALPRLSTQAIKRCILQGLDLPLFEGLKIEENEMTGLGDSEDTREGVRAFVEKREPKFTGR